MLSTILKIHYHLHSFRWNLNLWNLKFHLFWWCILIRLTHLIIDTTIYWLLLLLLNRIQILSLVLFLGFIHLLIILIIILSKWIKTFKRWISYKLRGFIIVIIIFLLLVLYIIHKSRLILNDLFYICRLFKLFFI